MIKLFYLKIVLAFRPSGVPNQNPDEIESKMDALLENAAGRKTRPLANSIPRMLFGEAVWPSTYKPCKLMT